MQKRSFIILIALAFLLAICGVSFADISVRAVVDKDTITIDDVVNLTVSVKGIQSSDSLPIISGNNEFEVKYRGSSSNFSMINGVVSSNIDYNYILEPKNIGKFKLRTIKFEYDGRVYNANPIKITVVTAPKQIEERSVFVTAEVSKTNPYVKEQILFKFKFYTRTQIANPTYNEPQFDNFFVEELNRPRSYQDQVDGRYYTVNEVNYALFPMKSGEYNIPPIKVNVNVLTPRSNNSRSNFFGRLNEYKAHRLRTEEIKLNVKPLPENRLKDMPFSNLVGDFEVRTSLGKQKLSVNDSTTLTIRISGHGNITDAVLATSDNFTGFKTYDDKPTEKVSKTKDGIYGTKIFKKAFIPLYEGKLIIPEIKFSYFDTKTGDYSVLSTPKYVLDVSPSEEKESLNLVEMGGRTTTKEAVKIIGRGILPLKTSIESLKSEEFDVSPLLLVLYTLFPGIIYIAFLCYLQNREKSEEDTILLRKKRAYKNYIDTQKSLSNISSNDDRVYYSELLKSLKDYMGERFNLVGSALTTRDMENILSAHSLSYDTIEKLTVSMKTLESVIFASAQISVAERVKLLKEISATVKRIEKETR